MTHQLRCTEYIDSHLDRTCTIGMPQVIAAKWTLNSALPQRPKIRRLELRPGSQTCPITMKPWKKTPAPTAGDPEKMFHTIQTEVAARDSEIPMFDVKTLEEHIGISLFPQRMAATLLSIFGLLALSLAALGLYGVMAYTVAQRTRELGIRVSAGEKQSDILRLILGEGLMLTVIGMIGGLITALAVTRLSAGLLYGVSAADPMTFTVVALILLGVAFVAGSLLQYVLTCMIEPPQGRAARGPRAG
jgi:predicted lysophospholipase L1 biosynthesis ABC-type transport system permease subunit